LKRRQTRLPMIPAITFGREARHGPGSKYTDAEVMADRGAFMEAGGRIPDAGTCGGCHRNPDRFDFCEWWPRIAHGGSNARAPE
jgi:hypothetical protein